MAFVIKDRVKEIITSAGTGAVSLGTSSATFDTFQSCMTNGDTTYYAIVHTASGVDEWEVGLGTFNTNNTLSRTTVLAGSSGTSTVNFSAGSKDVFMTYPAAQAALKGYDVNFADITVTGTVDGRDVAADGTKLDGIEASADVTDTANVTAAGALMDSELASIASVKALNQGVATTDSPTLTGLTVDGTDTEVLITEDSEGSATLRFADTQDDPAQSFAIAYDTSSNKTNFKINNTQRANFNSSGDYMVGPATTDSPFTIYNGNNDATKAGVGLRQVGYIAAARMNDHTMMLNRMGSDGLTMGIRNDGTFVGGLGNVGGELTFHDSTSAEAMRLDSSGNLGINNTNPSSALDVTGSIAVSGTVDGRDVAADGTKLDGIEASADVTDTANVTAAGALMDSEVTNLAQVKAFDSSDYATAAQGTTADAALPKAGGAMTGAITTNSTFDGRDVAADGTKLDGIEASATADQTKADIDALNVDADTLDGQHGSYYTGYTDTAVANLVDSSPGTLNTLNELAAALGDDPNFATTTATNISTKLSTAGGAMTGAITTNSTFDGRDVATDGTKLDTIETNADVTDTANVTAAGALMDSEVTNLAQVKAFAASAYATAAQGTKADAALPKAGGAMTGAITTNSTFDGRDVATDGTKLDGIEAGADVTDTANVTSAGALMDSEVTNLAQVKAFDSSDYATAAQGTTADAALPKAGGAMTGAITTNSTFDGRDVATDGTKLDGIEASADVTDTANVTAAGALMDSELTSIASVKALNQGVATTDSPTFAGLDVAGNITVGTSGTEGGEVTFRNPDGTSSGGFVDVSSADNLRLFQVANNSTMQIGQLGGTGGQVMFHTASAERMRINAAGNVGIGKTNPATPLDVNGTVTATAFAGNGSALTGISTGSSISGLAYGPWLVTTDTGNSQNSYVASVADDNDWMFIKVSVGTYTTGAGTGDSPTVTRYQFRKVYRTFS
jgi:uncharacterized protein YqgQ